MKMDKKKETTPVRCGVYTRVSSDEGLDQEFNSLDNQRDRCLDSIGSKKDQGWVFTKEYRDAAKSGGDMERPALQEAMADIVAHRVDVLLFHRLDRLSRSLFDFLKISELCKNHRVKLVSVHESLDTSSASGRLVVHVLASFAQFLREQASEAIHIKQYAARRMGKRTGGRPILGFDIDPKTKQYVVSKEEAALVNEIFDRYIADPRTCALAKSLNAEGKQRKSWMMRNEKAHENKPWTPTFLYRLLRNKSYIGIAVYKAGTDEQEEFEAEHPGIVEQDKFDQAQALLNQSRYIKHSRERSEIQALLKHIIFCTSCGLPMRPRWTRKKGKRHYYYVCAGAVKDGYASCPNPSLSAGEIESAVVDELRRVFVMDEVYSAALRGLESQYQERKEVLKVEQKQLEAELKELDTLPAGGNSKQANQYQVQQAKLHEVVEELEFIRLKLITDAEVGEQLSVLDRLWEHLFLAEKTRIVQLVIRRVDIEKEGMVIDFREDGIASLAQELRQECDVIEESA